MHSIQRHTLERQAKRSRLASATGIILIGLMLPLIFWHSSIPRFLLVIWGAAQIPITLTLIASVRARIQGRNRTSRSWNLTTLICWSLSFGLLPWLAPTASGVAPDKYMLFCAMLAVTGVIAVAAAQLPYANKLRKIILVAIATSYIAAYLFNSEPIIALIALMWFVVIYFNTEVNVHAALELKELRRSSEHDAMHDSLSTLYNRHGFLSAVQNNLAKRDNESLAIVDLNNFKIINDALGHQFGDHVLSVIGHRLKTALPHNSIVARIGGDEFAAIIPAMDQYSVRSLLNNTLTALNEPIELQHRSKRVNASIGVSTYKQGTTLSDWMAEADAAMYRSKNDAAIDISYFDQNTRRETAQRIELEDRFRAALANGEITFWCQPIVTADAQHPVGVELLARWPQPNGTRISPAEFIPIAHQTSLIIELGKQALAFASDLLKRWADDSDFSSLTVNVNISPLHLGVDLVDDIKQVFPEMDRRLGLEFVETELVSGTGDQKANLKALGESDIRLIIDDFGVGYSSLSYLWSLPVDELKIDRSFIDGFESDPVRQELIAAMVHMTRALNISCVAEGIETNAAARLLRQHGVNQLQGFGIATPQPLAEVEQTLRQLMKNHTSQPASAPPQQWPINTRSSLKPLRASAQSAQVEKEVA